MTSIKGIGNDILEIARMQKSIERQGKPLLNRLFTAKEQAYCAKYNQKEKRFAGRFAAKEAIAKALGTGIGKKLSWHDIEILADTQGKPIVHFSEKAKKQFHNPLMLISISHSDAYATAIAIWLE
ncbi:MAG: holo-[acyl-carrier-protein] synthase [Chlamydiae bacterium RIFCSPHIGHO2_12_FULL_44_59]|nr:MAG: holo-[acyl-carrier-protein] synthase [Chlamydiae bacterium RIFCSPHIGHO2_01_FULL_44_39]OGN57000.1 MAG: holo-[acyl-carrier-protein] synthase [Chlamydiae bacterium RIFCSPHIGHO2_02_FULL_45_9]OGN59554.1 MAG: holo-[acyl-carrier-protein] synthase [Chlamydiae bacterium RIFCSPHIGHO2_12_FULL_44_59]OGN67300.1 MAG: holo-[acyl-carrier-protein] synthase [Chlamydiae bacterium RIFCSPLOWO2_01_FULL_44_52]OGN68720.1 MAG: holo-[acyl-carrier-protein] synthase [Chlamydiae bacterium RIFCSPLOWO2_02_FULL_45_22]